MQMHFYFSVKVGFFFKNRDLDAGVFHTHFSSWIFKLLLCMELALIPIVIPQGTNNELSKGGGLNITQTFLSDKSNYQILKFIQTVNKEIKMK